MSNELLVRRRTRQRSRSREEARISAKEEWSKTLALPWAALAERVENGD
jgi:hypothetical protein